MTVMKRRTGMKAAIALAATITLALTGCSPGSNSGDKGPAGDDTLTWGVLAGPRSLDPAHGYNTTSAAAYTNMLEPLVSVDPETLQAEPALAVSWEQPDEKTWVFQIRDGVTFWNGDPLTAEDVAFSLSRMFDPEEASETASKFVNFDSVEATGSLEVTVNLKNADKLTLYNIGIGAPIMQKKYAEEHADDLGGSEGLIMGTGPFKVVSYNPATGVTMERNDDYWGEKPAIREVTLEVINDVESLRLALSAGEIDGTFDVPLMSSSQWEKMDHTNLTFSPSPFLYYLSLDTSAEPWSDIHVRRAVAHAIDKDGLVDALFGGHGDVADSLVNQDLLQALTPDTDVQPIFDDLTKYEFDIDMAKDELAKSAFPNGFEVTVPFRSDQPEQGRMLQVISESLDEIGITLTPQEQTSQQFLAYFNAHKDLAMQPGRLGSYAPEPGAILNSMLGEAGTKENGYNSANYVSQNIQGLLVTYQQSTNPAEQVEATQSIMEEVADQVPYIPLYFSASVIALNDGYSYEGTYSNEWTAFYGHWAAHISPAE